MIVRSRKVIIESCTFKGQFQGRPAEQATLETLLDIRQLLLSSIASLTEKDLEEHEQKDQ
jgi:hypothetical protein